MAGPRNATVTGNLAEVAAGVLSHDGLRTHLFFGTSLVMTYESVLAAVRRLSSAQLAVLRANYGLDGNPPREVTHTQRLFLGITWEEQKAIETRIVSDLREMLLAQPQDWSGLPTRVQTMLLQANIPTPQHLSPEAVLRIATDRELQWGAASSRAVNDLLVPHGFRTLREINEANQRDSRWGRRGL